MRNKHTFCLEDFSPEEISGKTFLVRVNFDDTHFDLAGEIDDIRMAMSQPTIDFLTDHGGKVILFNHIGRPGGRYQEHLRTDEITQAFSKLLNKPIKKIDGEVKEDGSFVLIGEQARLEVKTMKRGEIVMLDNTRFDAREKSKELKERMALAKDLQSLALDQDVIFVIDGFPITHRGETASVTEMAKLMPGVKGFWQTKEELVHHDFLKLMRNRAEGERLTAIFGGNKPDKQHEVSSFTTQHLKKGDYLILAGQFPNVLLDRKAENLLEKRGVRIQKPLDFAKDKKDVGPKTVSKIKEILNETDILFWEGPLGKFEEEPFHEAGFAVARHVAKITEDRDHKLRSAFLSGGELGWMTKLALNWKNKHLESIEGFTISTGGGTSIAFFASEGELAGTEDLRGWSA